MDNLIPILKECFIDSKIASDMTLGRTKTTNIITHVIAKNETQNLVLQLQKKMF